MTSKLWIAAVVASSALSFVATGCDAGTSETVLGGKGNVGGNNNGGGTTIDPETGLPVPNNPNNPNPNNPDPNNPNPNPNTPAPRCDMGAAYQGFAGTDLVADRIDLDMGVDRARVKPFSSLAGEYQRVLGRTPALLTGLGTTFGEPQARWSFEPQASAVSLYTAYRVAFQGCLEVTGATGTVQPAQYNAAPTENAARTECAAFAKKFWGRDATTEEVTACVDATVAGTTTETVVRRRWAYGCASVLTAAGFLSY